METEEARIEAEKEKFLHYYFIVYQPDPTRELVRFRLDGEPALKIMTFAKFINLVEKTLGYELDGYLQDTLHTYGAHYLLDREAKTIRHLQPSNVDQALESVGKRISAMKQGAPNTKGVTLPINDLAAAGIDGTNIKMRKNR